jgi:hypothetical protein
MKPPFFVVGIGRSGTTLLRLMLHHHPQLAVPYESGWFTRYYEARDSYGDLQRDANCHRLVQDILAEPTLQLWDHTFEAQRIVADARERTVPGLIGAIYSEYALAKNKARWGDKSDYLDRLHVIHEMFPNAQFIHIIRDGRDVAQSVLRLPWGPADIIQAAEWWNEHTWVGRRVGAILGATGYLEVRYEDLVEHPERELRRCCAFLGEDYSPKMLEYHQTSQEAIPHPHRTQHRGFDKPPDLSRVQAWKREMNPIDVALFEKHAHRMLGELGYEVGRTPVSKTAFAFRYLQILASRLRQRGAA